MTSLVIDTRMLSASGIGTYLQNIIFHLSKQFNLTLLGNEKKISQFEWYKNVRVIEINTPIYSIQEQLQLPVKIPICDIFFSPHYNIPILPIKARKRIVTIHDVFHLSDQQYLTFWQKKYAKFIIQRAINLSDTIVTVSEFSKVELVKYTNASTDKIITIHNGIDHKYFQQVTNPLLINNIRIKYKLPIDKKIILFVGNVKPHKNLRKLLEAFSNMQEKTLNECCLVIVGKRDGFITGDSYVQQYLNYSPSLSNKIFFTDYVESNDLPLFYSMATVFAFPSKYEGFGFPPLEAMACGCPTLVSKIASLLEICGNAAHYFNPNEVDDIVHGLELVINNETYQRELRNRGLQRAKSFHWEDCAQQLVETINRI